MGHTHVLSCIVGKRSPDQTSTAYNKNNVAYAILALTWNNQLPHKQ